MVKITKRRKIRKLFRKKGEKLEIQEKEKGEKRKSVKKSLGKIRKILGQKKIGKIRKIEEKNIAKNYMQEKRRKKLEKNRKQIRAKL